MNQELNKNFKVEVLKKEYNKYCKIFADFQEHIEKCYNNHFINVIERSNLLKILNDVIKQINIIYNSKILDYCENNDSVSSGKILDIKKVESLSELAEMYKMFNCGITNFEKKYKELFENPFDKILTILLTKVCLKIGFPSISYALKLLIGKYYGKLYNDETKNMIELYDKIFTPLRYIIKNDSLDNLNSNEIVISTSELNINNILRNPIDIMIKSNNNKYIVFSGYFINDSLNVILRTSQICNTYVFTHKKDLENIILQNKDVDDKFAKHYVRNIQLDELLLLTTNELYMKIVSDYETYLRLNSLSFINLIKEFTKNEKDVKKSIIHMYNIIRILLLGDEHMITNGGLLYSLIKDKKTDENDYGISDMIYENLCYQMQIKLKKTVLNIKNELNRIKSISSNDVDLKKQIIVCKNMPDNVKKHALDKIEEMKSSNNEYYKQSLYVKTLINYPWPSENNDIMFTNIGKDKEKSKIFLNNVVEKLDQRVYGHKDCKESIKELLGKWICNPSSSGTAIGLCGPPGVGKTLIAKSIGEAVNMPFVQITLGGQNDAELLCGHGYTYSAAQPGIVVKKMVEAGNARCVMYFDELDKACKKHENNEIFNVLIHLTDPITNTEFQDRFFQEINFPLNKVLFIFSYNDRSLIDPVLMDRIDEIDVKPYKLHDKKQIINKFIIKEMCDMIGFDIKHIKFSDTIIDFIINQYTHEPGIRDLKRKFEKIFLKMNIHRIYSSDIFEKYDSSNSKPIVITKKVIESYLGKESIKIQKIHMNALVGVINGLYATESGQGGIISIQVYENLTNCDDKFMLRLTGSQKKVMRESVITAFTSAIHHIKEEVIKPYLRTNTCGFHIHTPSGATPKDGPSAGGAFACAFVSRILNKKIKNDVAITGEIELTGNITKIGGLEYKLPGAKKAGIKTVLVSHENKDDIDTMKKEYPDLFDKNFTVILVSNLKEVVMHALVDGKNCMKFIK